MPEKGRTDNSLRGNALRRARSSEPPRTLTPYEWEQWYEQHGVPATHIQPIVKAGARPWWKKLLRLRT